MADIPKTKTKGQGGEPADFDHYLTGDGLDSVREKEIGQHIGYR